MAQPFLLHQIGRPFPGYHSPTLPFPPAHPMHCEAALLWVSEGTQQQALGKVVKLIRKASVIPTSFGTFSHWFRIFEWHSNDGMTPDDRDEIGNCPKFWPDIWDDRNDGNVFQMIKTSFHHHSCHSKIFSSPVIWTPQMTMGWMEWSPNDQYYYHELWLMEWHSNDGMTFKWQNDIQMTEWHSNDGMIHE